MNLRKIAPKLVGLVMALSIAMAGSSVNAAPAAASVDVAFEVGNVSGTITFYNEYSYQVRARVYNPFSRGSAGYSTRGAYFVGQGRYQCSSTPYHANNSYDTIRAWTDNSSCSYANIPMVEVLLFKDGSNIGIGYVDNPYPLPGVVSCYIICDGHDPKTALYEDSNGVPRRCTDARTIGERRLSPSRYVQLRYSRNCRMAWARGMGHIKVVSFNANGTWRKEYDKSAYSYRDSTRAVNDAHLTAHACLEITRGKWTCTTMY